MWPLIAILSNFTSGTASFQFVSAVSGRFRSSHLITRMVLKAGAKPLVAWLFKGISVPVYTSQIVESELSQQEEALCSSEHGCVMCGRKSTTTVSKKFHKVVGKEKHGPWYGRTHVTYYNNREFKFPVCWRHRMKFMIQDFFCFFIPFLAIPASALVVIYEHKEGEGWGAVLACF